MATGTKKTATVEEVATSAQTKAMQSMSTKSEKIRYLTKEGYTRGQVAKILQIRYQHVRNVLVTPLVGDKESKS